MRINVGRFERLAALIFSIKGPGALTELEDSIFATFPLDTASPREYWWPQQIESYGSHHSIAAVAGQFSWLGLTNPGTARKLVVVEAVQRSDASLMAGFRTAGTPGGLGGVGTIRGLDTRIPDVKNPEASLIGGTSATASFGEQVHVSATAERIVFPMVLAPDGTVLFRSGVVNESLELTIKFYEREANSNELA